jgi:hypothetical protein
MYLTVEDMEPDTGGSVERFRIAFARRVPGPS